MDTFLLCFIPLFVAVDAIGLVPLFVSLTEEIPRRKVRRIILQSVVTAGGVALLFLWFGPAVLAYLGITVPDFMIAGGILLLVISLSDLLTGEKNLHKPDPDSLGAVPMGVPMITGPAVLTTCILLANTHGKPLTAAAVSANVLLAGAVFWFAMPITVVLGRTGTRVLSKIASLLLTAIAVMLIRRGVTETILLATTVN